MGIYPSEHGRNASLNWKNVLISCNLTLASILTGGFCMFQAKSVREYGDSFYAFATELATLAYYLATATKMASILSLFEKFQELVETSEFLD